MRGWESVTGETEFTIDFVKLYLWVSLLVCEGVDRINLLFTRRNNILWVLTWIECYNKVHY